MKNIINGGESYIKEFYKYWKLSEIANFPEPISDKIQYFFGVDKNYLTKENLKNKEIFVNTILNNSTKSELEEDLELETIELLNCFN